METDDLDNLIADSLGGVQSALDSERKAAPPAPAPSEPSGHSSAGDAVRELQQGPARSDELGEGQVPNEEFFCKLVKTFQDENFQKAMADVLQGVDVDGAVQGAPAGTGAGAGASASPRKEGAQSPAKAAAPSSGSAAANDGVEVEHFLQKFLKSFDSAVGSDGNFETSLTSLMTSMLSNDLICEPLKQITNHLEPWLKAQEGLSAADRSRYEAQLQLYKQILCVYKGSPDPLPDNAREEVQRLLSELHSLGQPPEEVMRQITPKEAEDGDESFEDFMKTMGLDSNLGAAEQDLLKKLSEDPEELTKVMKDMAQGLQEEGLNEEACKQQ